MNDPVFLVNRLSGSRRGQTLIDQFEALPQKPRVIALDWPRLDAQIDSIPEGSTVAICGGDGTFSSVLPKFLGRSNPLALLPLGLGNDLARECRAARHISLDTFLRDPAGDRASYNLRIWRISDPHRGKVLDYFTNYLSLGFSSAIVSRFAALRARSPLTGRLVQRIRYGMLGGRCLFTRVPRDVRVSGAGQRTDVGGATCIIFSNIRSWMGFAAVQASDGTDDLLELTAVQSPLGYIRMMAAGLFSFPTPALLAREREWICEGLPECTEWNRDGELFTVQTPALSIDRAGSVAITSVIRF